MLNWVQIWTLQWPVVKLFNLPMVFPSRCLGPSMTASIIFLELYFSYNQKELLDSNIFFKRQKLCRKCQYKKTVAHGHGESVSEKNCASSLFVVTFPTKFLTFEKSPIITIDTEKEAGEKESVEDQPVEEYDWELLDLDIDTMIAVYYNSFLTWRPDAEKNLRRLYRGDSRSSIMHNKRKMKEELEANKDKKVRTLADFGFSVPVVPVSPVTEALTVYKQLKDEELEEIREAYEKISEMIKPSVSSDSELGKFALFEVSKHIVLKEYFQCLLNNCKKIEASEKAAEIFRTTPSKYCGDIVHGWAKEFLQFGKTSEY
ncbi:hypothetical protein PHYBLDRAFT_73426 [Phycomyces blakesleeanus NRRL 1555(-)]|uniref:Uncharacterized protein n=1 Tax=Phycomyces blakesleeanus (strain ATCC 8743b / DSM 1359 / FGSC 10004 / NBRC 33097 / NRRL 1555) TaxID=763407 RepID=A0A167RFL6_PHYB8|nr:hypothetical protein PHYBLDRAFT_73426 [Phycomyces blakesleeanus NRRL 1555(-)]OAD81539.1 hypothetical protein PHYBLDRAFT_73426 [Phycomyces blakesleeanus NRRL 1555(-)]|eukprot:XP_018299579.1 hypothetical protein PHYBLDRAFT_73426 [Phycomyces blakesleeanus NRRL 1555(-)]